MGDITEVIHKISYEVNDDALNNATKAIQLQIAELDKLNRLFEEHSRQLVKLSFNDSKQLNRHFEDIAKSIEKLAGKSKGILSEIFKGAGVGIAGSDGLKNAAAKYVSEVINEFKKLEDTGKVVVAGFANRTDTASAANDRMTTTLGKLGKGMSSVTGLLDIGINLLVAFADELDSADEKLGLITGSFNALNEVNRTAAADIAKVSTEIEILKSRFYDTKATVQDKIIVIEELNDKYADTIGKINDIADAEDFFINRSSAFVRAMTIHAQIQGAYNLIAVNQQKLLEAETKDPGENVGAFKKVLLGIETVFKPDVSNVSADYNRVLKNENDIILKEASESADRARNSLESRLIEMYAELAKLEHEYKFNQDNISRDIGSSKPLIEKVYLRPQNESTKREAEFVSYMFTRDSEKLPVDIDPDIDKKPAELPKLDEQQKGLTNEQKENIKEGIQGYQQLAQAAADAYSKIIQAQIDALDKEISVREKRVEEAKKLAERGNTEALRLEEDRLRKAQEQRARFARQQQTVNAAITVSNAIAAVARAALEGGGFGSAATIAALIAALAAGYAAVSSMTSDTESFATGVVDYKGKGGPRDDKNWVRISSGESIITAAGTQKNRALLEAINQGAALHMIDPTLPMMMPMLKQPGNQQGNAYAEAKDLKRLEIKLDEVVGAIENNKLKQNIFFNEQGVGIMTERAIQKDRKRWK